MKLTVLLGVLLLGCVGVFLWSSMGDEGVAELDSVDAGSVEEESTADPRRSVTVPRAKSPVEEKAASLSQEKPAEEEREYQSADGLDESNSILVEVVYAGTDRPFSGGTLSLFVPDRAVGMHLIHEMMKDALGLFRSQGTLYRLSEEGRTRIPLQETGTLLAAFNREYAALQMLRGKSEDPLRLEVKRIQYAQVRVTNTRGEPLEGIAARVGQFGRSGPQGEKLFRPVCEGETDSRGLARMQMLSFSLDRLPEDKVIVTASCLLRQPVYVEVRKEDLLKDVIDVILPEGGSLTVTVVDRKGRPFQNAMGVSAAVIPENADTSVPAEELRLPESWSGFSFNGSVTMKVVDCNAKLLVRVFPEEKSLMKPMAEIIDGPARVGEHLTVTLQLKQALPSIRGRILDMEGEPVSNARLDADIVERSATGRSRSGTTLLTDSAGRFIYPVRGGLKMDPKVTTSLEIRSGSGGDSPQKLEAILSVAEIMNGGLDLGDLVLKPLPVLVAGTVHNEDGAPIKGATFVVKSASNDFQEAVRFRVDLDGRRKSRKDGTFQLLGTTTAAEFRLMVHADGYLPATKTAQRGSRGVEFVLSRAGSLKGRIVLEGTSTIDDVSLLLSPLERGAGQMIRLGPDGSFETKGLKPGKFELKVHNRRFFGREPLARFGPFEVFSGNTTDVGELTVAIPLHRYELEVLEPAKRAGELSLHIIAREPGSETILQRALLSRGRKEIVLPAAVCDLTVAVDGYRELRLSSVTPGKVPIRLTRGIPVRIKVTNSNLIPKGLSVKVQVHPQGPSGFRVASQGNTGEVFYVSRPGKNILTIMISKKTEYGGMIAMGVQLVNNGPIEVADTNDVQTFEVTMDEESVQQVLTELNK